MYIDVLTQVNFYDDKLFTYSVPSNFINSIKIGSRVIIPFGNKKIEGFVMSFCDKKEGFIIKDIIDVLDDDSLLTDEMLSLGKYMSETYVESLINCYKAMLPSALKFNNNKTSIKTEKYIIINNLDEVEKVSEKNIIKLLKKEGKVKKSKISNKKALKILIDKNIVKEIEEEKYRLNVEYKKTNKLKLTDNQKKAFDEINNSDEKIYLLRGITGSGKTEIYMDLIEEVLNSGKTAIMLVPEISITTQLIDRFRGRFNSKIAVLHSSLSNGERYDEYRRIIRGEAHIVIGARSAIFAPLSNIGIIVIDEEHESTYKQENTPRYTTLDIALERIKYNNAKLLLGSATPSLESYARAKTSKYKLVELLERINKKELPKVEIIDMKDEMKKGNNILSDSARLKIEDRLNKKEQIMILYNRRGYSNYLICNECGEVLKCSNCDISLTYHKSDNCMKCHYCGYKIYKPNICSNCKSKHIVLRGNGTEKIEEYLKLKYKDLRIVRMDRDTTSRKGSHEKIIQDFNDGKYDILLGTQMIAKGLDFDNVTLVLILNGDNSLNIPDYRSSEKTFQLLTQASGRAGRKDKEGEIVIQTYNPNHYSILCAKEHDYISFYNMEMNIRKKLNYPPFCFLVAIRVISNDYKLGESIIDKINAYLNNNLDNKYTILGPSISIKIDNKYKFQCIIKYKDKNKIYEVLKNIVDHYKNSKIKLEIDFNPLKL